MNAWCPCCGDQIIPARSVTGMRGLSFCGIVCHDKWDLVFRGIDRRSEEKPLHQIVRCLSDMEEAGLLDHEAVGRAVLGHYRGQEKRSTSARPTDE